MVFYCLKKLVGNGSNIYEDTVARRFIVAHKQNKNKQKMYQKKERKKK